MEICQTIINHVFYYNSKDWIVFYNDSVTNEQVLNWLELSNIDDMMVVDVL